MLRLLIAIIFVFLFTSCDFFSSKKTVDKNSSMVLDTIIDYSSIDVYPMFSNCEGINGRDVQEECFGNELVLQLEDIILFEDVKGPTATYDTVFVDLLIARDNRIKVARIISSTVLKEKIPNLDSVLIASVNQLSSITHPAIKRGIPVRSQFQLPILIRVTN